MSGACGIIETARQYPDQIGKTVTPHVGIEADAKAALGQLVNLVPSSNRARASREAELTALIGESIETTC